MKKNLLFFAFKDMQFGPQQLRNFVPDSSRTLLRMDKHQHRDDPAASCTIHQCTPAWENVLSPLKAPVFALML